MVRPAAFALSFSLASSLRRQSGTNRGEAVCGIKGQSTSLAQIVGGEIASECAWPWQANIWTWQWGLDELKEAGYHCGGTLVHPEWVLTAQQCIGIGPWGLEVTFGMRNASQRSGSQQQRRVAEVYKHPEATDFFPYRNNLALLRLEEPVAITPCVSPACLPSSDAAPKTKCWITGFGPKSYTTNEDIAILREAEVEVWSNRDCTAWGQWPKEHIDESMVCVMGEGRRLFGKPQNVAQNCGKDRGGPLVCEDGGKFAVYGAASATANCGEEGKPGVYARVQPQAAWIRDTMASAPTEKTPVSICPAGTKTRFPNEWGNCACMETDKPYCYYNGRPGCPINGNETFRSRDFFVHDCKGFTFSGDGFRDSCSSCDWRGGSGECG